ncbi:unnamed protein product [Phytomonas sp. EM1]|nr:unnamed protein product [Phytomonas sp. EM1]|eukprot:CCW63686.1 unnamed protein product [Phytomonas sp. isolate EM1]
MTECRVQIADEARILEEDPVYLSRFSLSAIIAFSIWGCITLIVILLLQLNLGDKSRLLDSTRLKSKAPFCNGTSSTSPVDEGNFSCDPSSKVSPTNLPEGCRVNSTRRYTPTEVFGAVLGAHRNVTAFSNHDSGTCISMIDNFIDLPISSMDPASGSETCAPPHEQERPPVSHLVEDPHAGLGPTRQEVIRVSTGMQWQCVEYARRYWLLTGSPRPVSFTSVEAASDIWDLLTTAHLLDGTTLPLWKHPNGAPVSRGGAPPRPGDLLLTFGIPPGVCPMGTWRSSSGWMAPRGGFLWRSRTGIPWRGLHPTTTTPGPSTYTWRRGRRGTGHGM